MNGFPRMIYKDGGDLKVDGNYYSTKVIVDEDSLSSSLNDGWKLFPCKDIVEEVVEEDVQKEEKSNKKDKSKPKKKEELKPSEYKEG